MRWIEPAWNHDHTSSVTKGTKGAKSLRKTRTAVARVTRADRVSAKVKDMFPTVSP